MSIYQNSVTYCNMVIPRGNTLKYNTQYSIDPYCFIPTYHLTICFMDELCTHKKQEEHMEYISLRLHGSIIVHKVIQ